MAIKPITLLHISDTQFGKNHRFGNLGEDENFNTLLMRLTTDLTALKSDYNLRPQAVVLTGDLTEWGEEKEFDDALVFATSLAKHLEIPHGHFAIVPGNHDVHRKSCENYFKECEAKGVKPTEPFWPKLENYSRFFSEFYKGFDRIAFTEEMPWTLFKMDDLQLVVAGLNSAMKERHSKKKSDHYGYLGNQQLRSFKQKLEEAEREGLFRIAALHHNIRRAPIADDENLQDEDDFYSVLGGKVNLILHGHTHDGKSDLWRNAVPILATGSAAVNAKYRHKEVPNQYQIIQIYPKNYERYCRAYYPRQTRWIGDTSADEKGSAWKINSPASFRNTDGVFPLKGFNEKNNNPFTDVESFLEVGDIVTAFNLILKGKPFANCSDDDKHRYLVIRQKWGFIDDTDIESIVSRIEELSKSGEEQVLLTKFKVLQIKIFSQRNEFAKVIKLGGEIEELLENTPDQLPAFRHRMAVANAVLGNWEESCRWFNLAREQESSNPHSRLTTDSLQLAAKYFCNSNNSYAESLSQLKDVQCAYLRATTDPSFWQINGFKSTLQNLFAETAILLANDESDNRGRTRLIAAHLLASQVIVTPSAEGYAELLAMIWCAEHYAKDNKRYELRQLASMAMHSGYAERMAFQKKHTVENADVYRKLARVFSLVPRSSPTPENWNNLRHFLESVETELRPQN